MAIEVLEAGLETSVQDFPGRIGYLEQGFPQSGPMDTWSFRLGNLLVGNSTSAAGLECQYLGPKLRFQQKRLISITGAYMEPKIDNILIKNYQTYVIEENQILSLNYATKGVRSYICISGGLNTPIIMGSRSTFHQARIGGVSGGAIKKGDILPVFKSENEALFIVPEIHCPPDCKKQILEIEVIPGPNDDWISKEGHTTFFNSVWSLSNKSNRTGLRLEGPELKFSRMAYNKPKEHGQDPSNILDHGYPFGAINLAGRTPIILPNDGPTAGGFINPYTVPVCAFWKLAQCAPEQKIKFTKISIDQAKKNNAIENTKCLKKNLKRYIN